jgi:hypothetical protein
MTIVCLALDAQTPGPAAAAYRQAVDRYRTSPNAGVERMLALADADRAAAIDRALSATGPDAWSWDELAAAAMMHTDAGFYFLANHEPGLPHLLVAEKILSHALLSDPSRSAFVRRWYVTLEHVVRGYGDEVTARYFAAHYTDRFKSRPQTVRALDAYHRGVFAELDGCQKGEFLTIIGLTESGGNLVQRYFVPAAREFQAALSLEPGLAEAALHLGRIRMLEARETEAAVLLEQAAGSRARPVAYLAHLFLGAFDERASRWDAAESRYRQALAIFSAGQSAPLALAHLLDRRGRTADAAQVLAGILGRGAADVVDPWWVYFDEARLETVLSVQILRAETLK